MIERVATNHKKPAQSSLIARVCSILGASLDLVGPSSSGGLTHQPKLEVSMSAANLSTRPLAPALHPYFFASGSLVGGAA